MCQLGPPLLIVNPFPSRSSTASRTRWARRTGSSFRSSSPPCSRTGWRRFTGFRPSGHTGTRSGRGGQHPGKAGGIGDRWTDPPATDHCLLSPQVGAGRPSGRAGGRERATPAPCPVGGGSGGRGGAAWGGCGHGAATPPHLAPADPGGGGRVGPPRSVSPPGWEEKGGDWGVGVGPGWPRGGWGWTRGGDIPGPWGGT